MNLILVIGHTGQGKTTWLKKFIEGKRAYVFDVNNEYNYPTDKGPVFAQMRHVDADVKKFLQISEGLKNTNIVFEDATGFLRGRQSPDTMRQIVKKRHTGNNFIILFHSINRVPPELMEMANYLILFKTNDNLEAIDNKFHSHDLNELFLKQQKAPPTKYPFISYQTLKLI